jgi:hypothetical protein
LGALIAEIFDAAVPPLCADILGARCIYQDPSPHGHIEAMRLQFRPGSYECRLTTLTLVNLTAIWRSIEALCSVMG